VREPEVRLLFPPEQVVTGRKPVQDRCIRVGDLVVTRRHLVEDCLQRISQRAGTILVCEIRECDLSRAKVMEEYLVIGARPVVVHEDRAVRFQFPQILRCCQRIRVDARTTDRVVKRLGENLEQFLPVPAVRLEGAGPTQSYEVPVPCADIAGIEFQYTLPGLCG